MMKKQYTRVPQDGGERGSTPDRENQEQMLRTQVDDKYLEANKRRNHETYIF